MNWVPREEARYDKSLSGHGQAPAARENLEVDRVADPFDEAVCHIATGRGRKRLTCRLPRILHADGSDDFLDLGERRPSHGKRRDIQSEKEEGTERTRGKLAADADLYSRQKIAAADLKVKLVESFPGQP